MKHLDIIDEHIIIRETIGYDALKNIEIYDLPAVLEFLNIVYNYNKLVKLSNDK